MNLKEFDKEFSKVNLTFIVLMSNEPHYLNLLDILFKILESRIPYQINQLPIFSICIKIIRYHPNWEWILFNDKVWFHIQVMWIMSELSLFPIYFVICLNIAKFVPILPISLGPSTRILILAILILFPMRPSIKYVTLQGGGGLRKCDSL